MYLRWKGMESTEEGDVLVRHRPDTVKLSVQSACEYIRTRFGAAAGATAFGEESPDGRRRGRYFKSPSKKLRPM